MRFTVLYSENIYADDSVERRIYGPDVRVIFPTARYTISRHSFQSRIHRLPKVRRRRRRVW